MPTDQERWLGLFRGSVLSAAIAKHVSFLTSADTRAQGLILLNSALVPLAINGLRTPAYHLASTICVLTALVTICLCIFSLYPKRLGSRTAKNLLHYVSFSNMSEKAYLEEMKKAFADNEILAEMAVKDLHHLGSKIIKPKYFFLRVAYAVFLLGQLTAALAAIMVS
jgi:hypothetical protein